MPIPPPPTAPPPTAPPPTAPVKPLTQDERRQSLRQTLASHPEPEANAICVFAYGALMWWPEMASLPRFPARLADFRRSMCIWTVAARGTPGLPGLGLGLEFSPGTETTGLFLELDAVLPDRTALLERIWEREMWSGIYQPTWVALATSHGTCHAVAFVVDPSHAQYAGGLSVASQAAYIASAAGNFGPCRDYLSQTVAALAEYGIDDTQLQALMRQVEAHPRLRPAPSPHPDPPRGV